MIRPADRWNARRIRRRDVKMSRCSLVRNSLGSYPRDCWRQSGSGTALYSKVSAYTERSLDGSSFGRRMEGIASCCCCFLVGVFGWRAFREGDWRGGSGSTSGTVNRQRVVIVGAAWNRNAQKRISGMWRSRIGAKTLPMGISPHFVHALIHERNAKKLMMRNLDGVAFRESFDPFMGLEVVVDLLLQVRLLLRVG